MTHETSKRRSIASTLLLSAVGLMAILSATPAAASDLSPAEQCDAAAGSEHDLQRNTAFKPVATEDMQLGVALSACREAYKYARTPRITFQLARALHEAGQTQEAMTLLKEASEEGHAVAMVNYGVHLGERGDTAGEFVLHQRAAAAGNILAAYNLGVAYRDGVGTEVNGTLAAEWFARASMAKDNVATFNLAVLYDDGKLVPEDNAKAAQLYKLAAERGNVDAMVNLGIMLENGEGVAKDLTSALTIYKQAADLGDVFAADKASLLQPVDIGGNEASKTPDAG
ncbi:tetratricopeptide repeat protein [Pararhizobium sp.]|uniref:tetratricopeptide repeat protein n=1 Tax=Pararhizobium sp. TaxID=1977563 RepID=UPI00271958BC|nr:tetratricopeptide repeat protein [Pararhizobium sp.]MDO9416388.1 tetratricopeptide repeat protein [Pararhizobium sp.]